MAGFYVLLIFYAVLSVSLALLGVGLRRRISRVPNAITRRTLYVLGFFAVFVLLGILGKFFTGFPSAQSMAAAVLVGMLSPWWGKSRAEKAARNTPIAVQSPDTENEHLTSGPLREASPTGTDGEGLDHGSRHTKGDEINERDSEYFSRAALELEQKAVHSGLWLWARSEADGDENRAEIIYARARVRELKEEERGSRAQAREAEQIAALAKVKGKRRQEAESLAAEARKLAAVERRAMIEAWKPEREREDESLAAEARKLAAVERRALVEAWKRERE